RHQLVAHATYRLPLDFQVAGYFAARSGLPFTITTGRDNNGDSTINDRPDLVNSGGNPFSKSTYNFTFTGHTGNLPRNSARGPAFAQLDVRVSKFVRMGNRRIEAFFEAFNVINRVDFATPVGNLASGAFGTPTALGGSPRQG